MTTEEVFTGIAFDLLVDLIESQTLREEFNKHDWVWLETFLKFAKSAALSNDLRPLQ